MSASTFDHQHLPSVDRWSLCFGNIIPRFVGFETLGRTMSRLDFETLGIICSGFQI